MMTEEIRDAVTEPVAPTEPIEEPTAPTEKPTGEETPTEPIEEPTGEETMTAPTEPIEEPTAPKSTETPLLTFAADLTKEEFVSFYLTANSTPKREKQRKIVSAISSLLLVGMCVFFLVSDWQTQQIVDPMTVMLLLLSIGMSGFSLFGMTAMARRRAEREYDKAALIGHSYNGVVRVYEQRVEKETADGVTVLPLNANASFMEREDVMVLSVPNKPILLLFSRYLDKADADAFKQHILTKLPERNCRLLCRFVPKREQAMPLPVFSEREEPTEQLKLRFVYTDDEMKSILKEGLYRRFSKQAPLFGGLSLAAGILMWLLSEQPLIGALSLVVMALLTCVMMLWWPLKRMSAAVDEMAATAKTVTLLFTDHGVTMSMPNAAQQTLPWSEVTRAVNSPDYITLYTGTTPLIIPKRAIEQEEEFCRMVDGYMQTQEDPRGES